MKILVVNSIFYIPISGINRVVRRIGEELVARGHEYTVLTINKDNRRSDEWSNGIHVIKLPPCRYNYIGHEGLNIIDYLRKNLGRFDVVNIHNYYSFWTLIASFVCKQKAFPCVFTPHYQGIRGTKKGIYKLMYDSYSIIGRLAFKWADKIICVSEHEEKLIKQAASIPDGRFAVIPLGVDQVISSSKKRSKTNVISILYVGNLFESKGVQYVIRSIPVLKKRYGRDCKLSIVGDGPHKTVLENLIKNLNLADSVRFYWNITREELNQKYKEADVFTLLSSDEAYGIVVAEALVMGTPCIVTKATALTEFLTEPGCFGVNYPPDPNEVADLVIKIHDNKTNVGPFSNKIRTWDKVAAQYEEVYERVAAQGVV
jgi:glycosyltransferase involved in cell wall biosynthesis